MMQTGNMLCEEDRRHVIAAYVHRYTREHRPDWALETRPDGRPYPVQFASDADWLANSRFFVRRDGRLDMRHTLCHSSPTWPDGQSA